MYVVQTPAVPQWDRPGTRPTYHKIRQQNVMVYKYRFLIGCFTTALKVYLILVSIALHYRSILVKFGMTLFGHCF